mmetsp:Transcript_31257/g.83172  ORF Transcript_31257/g.83172 Transcript_31257/m.83172 type:complete len:148 (+) Transcript_31257:1289-1732(+)
MRRSRTQSFVLHSSSALKFPRTSSVRPFVALVVTQMGPSQNATSARHLAARSKAWMSRSSCRKFLIYVIISHWMLSENVLLAHHLFTVKTMRATQQPRTDPLLGCEASDSVYARYLVTAMMFDKAEPTKELSAGSVFSGGSCGCLCV